VEGAQIMYEIFDELIKQKGLSAYKVAKDTGISQTTLSDWKRDRSIPKEGGIINNIPSNKIEEMAKLFHCSPSDLMGWTDSIPDFSKTKFIVEKWLCNADFLEIDDLTGSQEVSGSSPPSSSKEKPHG
jgi:transcriptional regulator with XRE-family HTH domain